MNKFNDRQWLMGHHRFPMHIRSSHSKWYIRDDRWCLPKFWTWSATCDFHLKNCSKKIARSRILLVIFGNFMPNGSFYGVGMKNVDIWLSLKLSNLANFYCFNMLDFDFKLSYLVTYSFIFDKIWSQISQTVFGFITFIARYVWSRNRLLNRNIFWLKLNLVILSQWTLLMIIVVEFV